MPSRIAERIERNLGLPGLTTALSGRVSGSDFRSLMLEIYRERAAASDEAGIRAVADRDPLMSPCAVSARDLMAFDAAAFHAAAAFDALDLSPVCPFSAAWVLGGTSQNNVLTASRNAEVLGDSTIALAIEAARRRSGADLVRLCASHRVIRLQPFDVPGYSPHFRLFGMVTAGRDTGSFEFEMTQLVEHVTVYLRIFEALASGGFAFKNPLVEFTDMREVDAGLKAAGVTREEVRAAVRAHHPGASERLLRERGIEELPGLRDRKLEEQVIGPLREAFPEVAFRVNQRRLEGLGYYESFALRISPLAPDGQTYAIVDGGFTDWTARLMSSRKERLLISGLGTEFACKKYRV